MSIVKEVRYCQMKLLLDQITEFNNAILILQGQWPVGDRWLRDYVVDMVQVRQSNSRFLEYGMQRIQPIGTSKILRSRNSG